MFRYPATLSLVFVAAACGGEVTPQLLRGRVDETGFPAGVAEVQVWSGTALVAAAPLNARKEFVLALLPGGPYRLQLALAIPSEPIVVTNAFVQPNMMNADPGSPLEIYVCQPSGKAEDIGLMGPVMPPCRNPLCEVALDELSACTMNEQASCFLDLEMSNCPRQRDIDCAMDPDPQLCAADHYCTGMESRCNEVCFPQMDRAGWACSQAPTECSEQPIAAFLQPSDPSFNALFGCNADAVPPGAR